VHAMSVEMEAEVEGLEGFQEKMERAHLALQTSVQARLAELADSIKETAQQLAPVRTGYLRSTIYAQVEDWSVKVGATAPYAAYVEHGTRYMYGRRFLSRSLEAHLPQLESVVGLAVEEALKEAST